MRIGFISTYPPIECGVGMYTHYLTTALRQKKTDVYIVAHLGAAGRQVFPAFDYDDPDLPDKAFSVMIRFTPDVVHIQHEFGLYGKNHGVNVVPLILNFRLTGFPVVTTLHTVYEELQDSHQMILETILLNSNKVIVHEEYQRESLNHHFQSRYDHKIHVIPHGAREVTPIAEAKKQLDIPTDKKVILMIGYFRPSKNFELIVDAFPEIRHRYPNVVLVIAGKIRGTEYTDYRNRLFRKIQTSPAKDAIFLIRGQLPQPTFDTILSAADVVVLPYKITSQSGILAHSLAFGKPVVASNTPAMENILKKSGAGLIASSREEFIEKIVQLLREESLAQQFSQNAIQYVKTHISWSIVAEKHIALYRSIIESPQLDNQIIWVD